MAIKGETRQSDRYVDAVLAACEIIDSFLNLQNQTLKQIIDQTRLTRNRVMRLTGTLEARGYLIRKAMTGTYSLGPRVMSLGRAYERQFNLGTLAQPMLQELAKATGESSSIHIYDNMDRIVLAREESDSDIRLSIPVGNRSSINLGASGKILLAFGPEEMRDNVIKNLFPKTVNRKKSSIPRELSAELRKIRKQGYVFSVGVRAPDAANIAAPIFGQENRFLASLLIGGPIQRFSPDTLPEKIRLLMNVAAKLTWRLGGDQSLPPR